MNVKLSNSQLNKLKSAIKNGTDAVLRLSSNMIDNSKDYSRDNSPDKIKHGVYVINLDEYSNIRTHWIALYLNAKTVTYSDSFGVEHIPKGIKTFTNNKNIISNIFRIRAYDSIICR